jgi:hypothetical protein
LLSSFVCTGEQSLLQAAESARYQQLLDAASAALFSYDKCSPSVPVPHMLRRSMLDAATRARIKWQGVMRMGDLLDTLLPLFLMRLLLMLVCRAVERILWNV